MLKNGLQQALVIIVALGMLMFRFAIPSIAEQNRADDHLTITLQDSEVWWGGAVADSSAMPYGTKPYSIDLLGDIKGNQAQPMLVSTQGRFVWCDQPIKFAFDNKSLTVSSVGKIDFGQAGTTLRDAYLKVSSKHFPTSGRLPAAELFTLPQYNTWIELMYDQNQQDILAYAGAVRDNGFPPGVLMIDDNWQTDYGNWTFKAEAFEDPKEMVRKLHELDFKVMLWVCPLVSPDSTIYRKLRDEDLLVRDQVAGGQPAMIRWWNGVSASVDFLNPRSSAWFSGRLDYLVDEFGVDGFKFDGGDASHYVGTCSDSQVDCSNALSEAYARLGLAYPYNEYRACWKMGGQPLAQRLRDKRHSWEDLQQLIPGILAQGLMGYSFTCPDMIGGGEYGSFLKLDQIDQELLVRSAQCQALMPMMQFSVAPWRVLDDDNLLICEAAAKLHERVGNELLALAQASAATGEPIVRSLEYEFPHQGYSSIVDQYMLGSDIMVAPVLEDGMLQRSVHIPPGEWLGDDGVSFVGPKKIDIAAPLERLPWFRRIDTTAKTVSQQ